MLIAKVRCSLLTGDHKISETKIHAQLENREEWKRARELYPVNQATLEDLDLDKLNEYIQSLNQKGIKKETLKPDLKSESAISFLNRKFFIDQEQSPTLLGMLVCGKYIDDFIGGRCQVDAYVDVDSTKEMAVAKNKKVFKNNILQLMDDSYIFCLQNIQMGISYAQGGRALVSSSWRLEKLQYKRFNKASEFEASPPKLTLFQEYRERQQELF